MDSSNTNKTQCFSIPSVCFKVIHVCRLVEKPVSYNVLEKLLRELKKGK